MTQWAQLKGGPPARAGLERGHWYRVEAVLRDDMVRVLGPNAVGVPLDLPSVRIIDHDPDAITRVQATGFQPIKPGQPTPQLSFYGVCPRGHRVDPLPLTDQALCPRCRRTYQVEDEERF